MTNKLNLTITLDVDSKSVERLRKAISSSLSSIVNIGAADMPTEIKKLKVADETVVVEMKIVGPGLASFVESSLEKHSEEIISILLGDDYKPVMRNGAFRTLSIGTTCLTTFRISTASKRRMLISVAPIKITTTIASIPEKLVEEIEGARDIRSIYDEFSGPPPTTFHDPRVHDPRVAPETTEQKIKRLEVDDISSPSDSHPFSADFRSSFYIAPEVDRVFRAAKALVEFKPKRAVKILIAGESGYGKTSLAEGFAVSQGLNFLRLNCATIRDPEEWFGYREAKDGSTIFVPNQLTLALREGNYVICFDEYNRIEPDIHNSLLPLLDHGGKTVVHGETIEITQNIIFIATINFGYQYTGTYQLDQAIINRFQLVVEVSELPPDEEVKILTSRLKTKLSDAKRIVQICNRIRTSLAELHCSVRTSLDIAEQVTVGIPLEEAFLNCLQFRASNGINGSANQRKELIDILRTV